MSDLLFGVGGLFSLHSNAAYGRLGLVKSCLLLGRADVNGKYTSLSTTPLHAASYNGHLNVVKYLIEVWSAQTNLLSQEGWTCLHCAAMNGYLPVVKYLIEEAKVRSTIESNVRRHTNTGTQEHNQSKSHHILTCASSHTFLRSSHPHFVFALSCFPVVQDGWTCLHCAAAHGFLPVVKYLVEKQKMDVEFTTYVRTTTHTHTRTHAHIQMKMIH